ncbi:hypothetical protein CTI12_AA568330 [Artemisia annua]|uniref:Replication protein A 70 kDa DNA-binding subunit B/D first OB fold domain-containing protein n=1 Tax=Artemisia annua TaxID=35608 RepID=A0A2U1KT66_ARTAN|nr:hypothetical protein CTI12_AA568330 [Artemisia annua]
MSLTTDADAPSKSSNNPIIPSRQFAYLTDLNPADNSKFIQVRVYRKWTTTKMPGFTPIAFSCMLLDKKGSAIQANADLKEKDRFDRDLQINCVYKIQGFGFEKADSWGKTLDNDITLSFGKYTQADLLQDNDYPFHYFNFAAFNELSPRLEKKNPILTGLTRQQLEVQTERLTDWHQERTRNRVPLTTLLQIDPKTQQRVLFTQDAKILQIDTSHDWYYQKCDECGGKLTYGYLHGQCHQYGTTPNPQNRIVITDGTANAVMSCFTPQTDGLIKDVNALLKEVDNKDPAIIPPAILALQNTRHVFQFQFATPTAKPPPTFVLKKIMDSPSTTLPEPPASTSFPLISSAGPSSPPTDTPESFTSEGITPPPATPAFSQDTPGDSSTITHQPVDPPVRKQLFIQPTDEEDDPAPKKQKTD